MADNKDKKVLKSSIEREQSQTCLNSAEREKIKGSTNLNVPHLRFPEFSGEWECSTIGSEFELYSGNTPSRLDKEQFNGNVNWISSGELKEHYIYDTKEKITEEAASCNNLRLLPIGTFVIAIYGLEAEGVRGTGSVTQKKSTISQACMAFSSKGAITNEFLYSWYKKHGNLIGFKYAQGTKQQNLSYDIISQFRISYPSITEQKKLEDFISLIDERLATQNKIIEKMESLINGIYDKVLWQSNKQTSLSEILVERNERTTINNQYQVLSSTAKGLYRQSDYFDKEVASANNIGYKVLRFGDIVLSPQNLWLGNINYNDLFEMGIVSPSYKVFSIRNSYNPYYVSCFLKTPKALYEYTNASEQGASVVRRNLDINAFMAICFPMPNKILQDKTSERLRKINMKLDIEKQIHERLNVQKQYLLRQMFI